MKVRQVFIENFRSYRNPTRIELDGLTTFVGRNDAGKSSVLEALEIFFNNELIKIEAADVSIGSLSKKVRIGCVFSDLPSTPIVLDKTATTTLQDEYLLNSDGDLEIHKVFDCGIAKVNKSVYAVAQHPSVDGADDLLEMKSADLKKRLESLKINADDVDLRSKPSMRSAIWKSFNSLELQPREIPLDKEDCKLIWENIEQWMPLYALFRADRPSTDEDSEVQDPMKLAVQQALKESQELLESIKKQVREAATEVAARTVDKLKEFAPELAQQFSPHFRAEPKWDQLFKLSLTGDDAIPVNKRGSGVRRLILLSFFRAAAESTSALKNSPSIVYAIEEPETCQHPIQQKLLMQAFRELVDDGYQVLVTTHNPAFAGLVPVSSIRYVRCTSGNTETFSGDDTLRDVANDLGVLPDHRIRVFVCVEGPNDCSFLKHISKKLHSADATIPSLSEDPRVALFHLGGSNLTQWVQNHYLQGLNIPEVHLYDRGTDNPPKFQEAVNIVVGRGGRSYATLTGKREMENYLHPNAIERALGVRVDFGDDDSVPEMVGRMIHESAADHGVTWDALDDDSKGKKMSRAKIRLNDSAAGLMSLEELLERDAGRELENWLRRIGESCE
jgi:putative ATP-dependent endonuclease of OLD family